MLVGRGDIFQALINAILVTYALARHPNRSKWTLQSYTAFRWFLVRYAIDRISGPLVIAEHFDRWAVLIDRSIRESRRKTIFDSGRRLVLIQHGALGGMRMDNAPLKLPIKLGCVDMLYAYDESEEDLFRNSILISRRIDQSLRVEYFKPSIKLSGEPISSRPRILFVGHPICEHFHAALYCGLKEAGDVDFFYKPHPKASMSSDMAKFGWKIIYNSEIFPRVDLLIAYPSTLVIEYKESGIEALVHPIDIRIERLPEFISHAHKLIEVIDTRTRRFG
jgi:hypothetical protein